MAKPCRAWTCRALLNLPSAHSCRRQLQVGWHSFCCFMSCLQVCAPFVQGMVRLDCVEQFAGVHAHNLSASGVSVYLAAPLSKRSRDLQR